MQGIIPVVCATRTARNCLLTIRHVYAIVNRLVIMRYKEIQHMRDYDEIKRKVQEADLLLPPPQQEPER